ncbi:tyrosine-protein kinase Etk/Wzc [Burkholderia sp. WP9]|uniref:polysaccharide biosynthesis tyrosine autokinase n=1 Tax=Burkholderia sp. WP9 TaxID=1500263 RepID=UPI0008990F15|nr:polysaccharide biosynthesis tyrosine autokinase [Burkholderia sp. WP9]SED08192.1 tyrosine-protein kinase Etk/Wzc [Burkholderia sp. WP9]
MKTKVQKHVQQRPSTDAIDFLSAIDSVLDHKRLIAAATIGVFLIGCAYAFLAPPVYEANALIKVADADKQPPASADTLSYYVAPTFNDNASAEAAIQVIGSRHIVAQAVANDKLYINAAPHRFPLIGLAIAHYTDGLSDPGLLGLGGYVWGGENIKVGAFDVPQKFEDKKFTVRALADDRYDLVGPGLEFSVVGRIGVTERFGTKAGPLTVRIESIHSRPGGEFIVTRNSEPVLVEELQKKLKLAEAGTKTHVVKLSMQGTDPIVLARTVKEISDLYVNWSNERKARLAHDALAHISETLPEMERQVTNSETAYNNFRDANGMLDLSEEGRLLLKQIADNNAALLELKRKRQALSATFARGNANVVAADQQIDATQRAIDALNVRVRAMPQTEQGALQLMRNVRVNTDVYVAMRKYAEEMQVVSADKAGSAEIIDPAEVPARPVRPVKWLIMLGSLLLGAVVGGGGAIVWDRLRRGVTDTDEIESASGLNVYATIPVSDRQEEIMRRADRDLPQQLPLAASYPRDPAIESLRMLRSAIQLLLLGAPNNVIMLAGPLPEIGKSFLATNLATVLAAGGKRVLLIDGDLRKGQLYRYLRVPKSEGLSEVLSGHRRFDEVVTPGGTPNLDLLQTGSYPAAAADLLTTGRFSECVRDASRAYDIVLIDTPAVLAVSDAGMMAPVAGSVFLVVRFADTLVGEIDATIKRLGQAGARISGIVLNRVKVRSSNYAMARRYGTYAKVAHHYDSSAE